MKKNLFVKILSLVMFFFIFKVGVVAQTPTPTFTLPLINCGNAEATIPAQRVCCKSIEVPQYETPTLLSHIPVVGERLQQFNVSLLLLKRLQFNPPCLIGYPSSDVDDPNCRCLKESEITPTPIAASRNLCEKYIPFSLEKEKCIECANKGGVWTSLTCVYGDISRFITEIIFSWAIGFAGIIALFCIIYAAIQLQTSQGSPEKIKKAQELLTSCIMGLMLIIFSVFILKLIGVNILRIPGFR